jgi:hypothetical protein
LLITAGKKAWRLQSALLYVRPFSEGHMTAKQFSVFLIVGLAGLISGVGVVLIAVMIF